MSPRPSVKQERREKILSAARSEIVQRGYARTRVADIARSSRTSSATIHYYFPTRTEVLSEALCFATTRARERHAKDLTEAGTVRDQLVRLVELQIPVGAVQDDFRIWLEVWNEASRRPELRSVQDAAYEHWVDFVTDIVVRGQRLGEFAPVDAREFVAQLLALLDGLAIQVVAGSSHIGPEEMHRLASSFLERELFAWPR